MKSKKPGKNTSKIEVINVSQQGLWILVGDKEYFLSAEDYPWFQEARLSEIFHVQWLHSNHLYWPDLDVDLEVSCLENPSRYPLVDRRRGALKKKAA